MLDSEGLGRWVTNVAAALGVAGLSHSDRTSLLDVARQVAHDVYRPATPLTTYLMGMAVGQGMPPTQAAATVAALTEQRRTTAAPPPAVAADA